MASTTWIDEAAHSFSLSDDIFGYLMGRGGKEGTIESMGLKTWSPLPFDCPDETFCERFGSRGDNLSGNLFIPLYSTIGTTIGFQVRDVSRKKIYRHLLPDAEWFPLWIGIRRALPKVWNGGRLWIVEGLFDLFALEWAVPDTDGVVSSIRAKLTKKHVDFVARVKPPLVSMVYDHDETGRKGVEGYVHPTTGRRVWGALESLRYRGVTCRKYVYNPSLGKDPGEIWDRGGEALVRRAFATP